MCSSRVFSTDKPTGPAFDFIFQRRRRTPFGTLSCLVGFSLSVLTLKASCSVRCAGSLPSAHEPVIDKPSALRASNPFRLTRIWRPSVGLCFPYNGHRPPTQRVFFLSLNFAQPALLFKLFPRAFSLSVSSICFCTVFPLFLCHHYGSKQQRRLCKLCERRRYSLY